MWSARIKISKQVCLPCYLFYTATFLVMTICSFHVILSLLIVKLAWKLQPKGHDLMQSSILV
jgi:hypothetical protein